MADIRVTLNNGQVKLFQNVPDDITPDQVKARVVQQFGDSGRTIEKLSAQGQSDQSGDIVQPQPINENGQQLQPQPQQQQQQDLNPTSADMIKAVQPTPEPQGPTFGSEALAVADKSVRGGVLALPEAAQTISNWGASHQDPETRTLVSKLLGKMLGPPSAETAKVAQTVGENLKNPVDTIKAYTGGDIRQPQTGLGKFLGEAGQGAVSALTGPGGFVQPGRNAIIGASAGAGGELASLPFQQDSGAAGLARLGGSIATGGLAAIGSAMVPNADTLIKQSTKYITPNQWKSAQWLESTLKDSNISHLKSQLLGPHSTLDDLVETASAHPDVKPLLISAVNDAPTDVRKAFVRWMDQNLELNPNDSRRQLLQNIQDAAGASENAIKSSANSAYTSALKPGVSNEMYHPDYIASMRDDLLALAKDPNYAGENTDAAAAIKKYVAAHFPDPVELPDGTLLGRTKGSINTLVKELNTIDPKNPDFKDLPTKQINEVLHSYTADDFGAARDAKKAVMEGSLSDFQRGIAGDIAHMGGGSRPDKLTANNAAITRTFPKDTAQASDIVKLGDNLGGDVVSTLFRENISKGMENALMPQLSQTENLRTPFQITKSLFGTEAQKANTKAALQVIAGENEVDPGALYAGYYKLMRAFDSFKDLKLASSVNKATLERQAGSSAVDAALTPHVSFRRKFQDVMSKKAYTKIANIVTSPDGIQQIMKISKSADPSHAEAFARSVLATAIEDN